jgi:hypothetical protein
MRPAVAIVALALAALTILPSALPAYAATPDPILGGGLFAQNLGLTYRWSTSGTPPSTIRSAIARGVGDANATRLSRAPTFAYSSGSGNLVYYGTSVPCGVNALACMRRDPPGWFGVWYRENGHRYDWGSLRWCEMTGSPNGCFEAENVALHEFGHVMILDHHVNLPNNSDALDAVMQRVQPAKPKAGWNAHAYARCDVATLQQQYDVQSWATPYSTCLDVPTGLKLASTATAVVVGSKVVFTGTLSSKGTGRLSNNPVSSRIVVLQGRSSGGWSNIATMTAGSSGTYSASVAVWAARDFRAVFARPAGEGLRASTSTTLTVTAWSGCAAKPCPLSVVRGGT